MAKDKAKNRSWGKRLLIFMVTRLLVFLVIAGIIFWQWDNISAWISSTTLSFFQVFGFGLVLMILAVLVFVEIILTKPMLLLRYWNKWIGAGLLSAATWGILAFFPGMGRLSEVSMGGLVGMSLIGEPGVLAVLIILLLIVAALFFIIPRGFAGFIANIFGWIFSRFQRAPAIPADVPIPAPTIAPRATPLTANVNTEPMVKPTAFPKYSPEVKPKPAGPVYGSKNWIWNRLHPQPEAKVVAPVVVPPGSGIETAASKAVPEAVKAASQIIEPEIAEPQVEPEEVSETESSQEKPVAEEKKAVETPVINAPNKDNLQAAQEVWKKYGEAGTSTTADGWKLPPVEILDNTPDVEFSQADNEKKAGLIVAALASYGVEARVTQINVGPTVTQFGIEPGWDRKFKEVKEKDKNGEVQVKTEEVGKTRVKVDRITSLANDLALALAAPSIRIEAPVPGKPVVGIEVPNTTIGVVSLRGVVESNIFQKMQAKSKMAVALGKGAGGESVVGDLTKMPHLLIAGATGSGKTVCIHAIICGFLLYNTPNDLKFIMIDPKRVELTNYNSLPHLATPVIVDNKKALGALRWLTMEMDKRYQTMASARARNIEAYNKARPNEKLPYLVLVIDELADLMMTAGEEVEQNLCRLAQLARAVGIHLIVATQRPSVDVVTGLIKSNFPTRISFAVTSQVDSRTILDSGGAEKLLGRGDMLYMPTEASKAKRLQGCFLSDPEIERLVYFWNNQKKETASQLRMEDIVAAEVAKAELPPADPMLEEARKLLQTHEHISASFLQRHLRIGYPRAARIMETLEAEMVGISDDDGDVEDDDEESKEDRI